MAYGSHVMRSPIDILHIALQGCLRLGAIDYGVTSDTGGHIRYLQELVGALAANRGVGRQTIVTRGFDRPDLGSIYGEPCERDGAVELIRLFDGDSRYLPKEDLWRRHDRLIAAFLEYLGTLEKRPDIIHAHYADAGLLAIAAKRAFGIPYIFTAHSLAEVKRRTLTQPGAATACRMRDDTMDRRSRTENEVLQNADLIIASSRDEAENQLGLYAGIRPERIRVHPPGCDLAAFQADDRKPAKHLCGIEQFLREPDKPCLLAIARPVRKKNLAALLDAYGRSLSLQEKCNLVVVAGTRTDLSEMEDENREVIEDLILRIDHYDAWGKVALPKRHFIDDVPHIYAWARRRRGIFVNPALNEPFGLTLLEAAASGLPVIATNQGGPNDILERCGNGVLIDPNRPDDLTREALRILADDDLWAELARTGRDRVRYYDWDRHARDYLDDARLILSAPHLQAADPPIAGEIFLLSDIDNTLAGNAAALARFQDFLETQPGILFGIATGRSLHAALAILKDIAAPIPRILVTSVGSEIYYTTSSSWLLRHDEDFARHIDHEWDRGAIAAFMRERKGIVAQGPMEQRRFKLSYFADLSPDDVEALRDALRSKGLRTNVVYSHGRYLDILPARAGKGKALRWLAQRFGIGRAATFAAGDSGNDVDMLLAAGTGLVVGNHDSEIAHLIDAPNIRFCEAHYAGAIVEGMEHGLRSLAGIRAKPSRTLQSETTPGVISSHAGARTPGAADQSSKGRSGANRPAGGGGDRQNGCRPD